MSDGNAPPGAGAAPSVPELTVTLFSASFCGACARTRAVLERTTALLGDRVALREVNVALDPAEGERLDIVTTPTTVVTGRDGAELGRAAGVPSAPQVLTLLAKHL